MKGIKVNVTMSRTLYLDIPENTSEEEVQKKIQEEIILPTNALYTANQALKAARINIPKLDLKDWTLSNVEYTTL